MSSRPWGGMEARPYSDLLVQREGGVCHSVDSAESAGLPQQKGPPAEKRATLLNSLAAAGYFDSSTCSKSSSTGVARPKIDTDTLTRFFSKSSSSTTPLKLAKGPSSTLTLSPIS